uniref:DNA-directed RNA polymerase II subunit RPB7 n=1 Tax=Fibrocapsa japonica TaxID=94617 RepID=A0A7S2Y2T3_9STRA|mmetsp:Transcript_3334/g.4894  ORF Transcript_3334/g.4894 Transcript_3334/m.4894 type:complete len:182 (+) Transcript_3334:109-654(+)|eukprot:CAMPEP_0113939820 /NCGR_PEP_ID=MMETSP1339-20121228/6071_1 /TAXON_ID=94617 /ORGANISM="Fibrocapsa japonica" /LENGTH=181 /DNA_ID=CAMNT_0000943435 /DNA_START=522 /DNA_END=1067 /DNA_ORIENTATION=- /assembly_acc=CAM_ASM_000762
MFFLKELTRELLLPPAYLGPKIKETIRRRLIEEVEGTCLGKYGYVITVTEVKEEGMKTGVISNEFGEVIFHISYDAICFRPFKGEVLDANVTVVTELGFFAEVGPLQVFVSRHAMPQDLQEGFDAANEVWVSEDKEVELRQGCGVRLRIMGLSVDAADISAIGTIKDDYLGLISAAEQVMA